MSGSGGVRLIRGGARGECWSEGGGGEELRVSFGARRGECRCEEEVGVSIGPRRSSG